ncbi:hypothetical protein F2Q69_00000810 [Brassica cretica]|uniref:Rhodanese domain-containing protein n=1 Tax=Brassica cretica TaxID=69181 RepID=A0A8S9P3F1_BRACR|nr:hypothetical protein F2Q69_00000810 [Brassica cretica]
MGLNKGQSNQWFLIVFLFCFTCSRATASLPGFKVFPLRQFGTWAPDITSKLNPEKDTFVLCKVGGRSMQVANWLQSQGFKSVYNVAGGIQAYSLKVDPSIPTY